MTWKQFAQTGAVEDYLEYKGVDWRGEAQAQKSAEEVRMQALSSPDSRGGCGTAGSGAQEAGNGTDDHGDGTGIGGLSLR